jgi:HAD superfamily hydrolase (TIGR01450 family)
VDIEITASWAFNRYQETLGRLPRVTRSGETVSIGDLSDIEDQFDVFVFDAFGVLNVGETPIEGAALRIEKLRQAGKQIVLLTNSASQSRQKIKEHFSALGFDFTFEEIVTSRDILIVALAGYDPKMSWGIIASDPLSFADLPCQTILLDRANIADVDGFIFLRITEWTTDSHEELINALHAHPRPVLIGNPDLVGPRENSFSRQPGYFAHDIWDRTGIVPQFFGKPYANAFDLVRERLGDQGLEKRVVMAGDTLHTDILGATVAGFSTALVTGQGVMRGLDIKSCIEASGIHPDFILPTI